MPAHIERYSEAFRFSQNFIIDMQLDGFPFNIFELGTRLLDRYGLVVRFSTLGEYNDYRRAQGKPAKKLVDGLSLYDPGTGVFLIVYNEAQPWNRIRFTLMHEIGHIVLGHMDDQDAELSRGGLADWKYYMYEGEANVFAGNVLAPPILIVEALAHLQAYNPNYLASLFDISKDCAIHRKYDYMAWLKTQPSPIEQLVWERYCSYVRVRECEKCEIRFLNPGVNNCPVCGHVNQPLQRSEDLETSGHIRAI